MKHARADYDRIQDPSGKIPENEPVFLLRAQDKHFDKMLRHYRLLVEQDQGDPKIIEAVTGHIALAKQWPIRKAPDL